MANVKISDLTAYVDPASSDILPIVDLVNDVTKKVTIADLLENAGDGSAAAPAFAFNSDSNTGIYKSGADELSFATAGTQRLVISSAGVVSTSEHLNIASAKEFRIAGTKVLDATSLGTAVVASSLTSVGTIATGVWNGTPIATAYIADDAVTAAKLANTSVTAGSYTVSSITVDAQGRITSAANGAASDADKIVEGNTEAEVVDTGSNGHFKVTTEGTERLRIDSSGNVAIGTANPVAKLDVRGTAYIGTSLGIDISNPGDYHASANDLVMNGGMTLANTSQGSIFFADSATGTGEYVGQLNYYHSSDSMAFVTNNGERMRIDSSGNVQIGSTNSDSFKFKVTNGAGTLARFTDGASQTLDIRQASGGIELQNPNNGFISFKGSSAERMRIDSSGRLIVGRTASVASGSAADSLVQIVGKKGSPTDLGQLTIARGNSASSLGSGAEIGEIIFSDNAGANFAQIQCNVDGISGTNDYPGRLTFHTTADGASSPTERMRIDSSGTTTFIKTVNNTAELLFGYGSSSGIYAGIGGQNNFNTNQLCDLLFYTNGSTGSRSPSERMRIDSSGNVLVGLTTAVGIGGTPADLNSVEIGRGFLNISRDDTAAADHILFGKNGSIASSIGTSTTNSLVFKTGTAERMRIDSSGKVGINISNPGSYNSAGNELVLGNTGSNGGLTIVSGTGNNGHIFFADGTSGGALNRGIIKYEHGSDSMAFNTAESERMRIDSSGVVGIGDSSPSSRALKLSANNTTAIESATPLVYLKRSFGVGGGSSVDETTLHVDVPGSYNSAGVVYGVRVNAKHNLNGSHYAGHFVNAGSQYAANGTSAVYAETHKTDTNGPGQIIALHANGRITSSGANTGYAVAGFFQSGNNINGRPIVCLQEYTANTYTHQIEFRKNNGSSIVAVGSIKSNNTATQYNTSSDYRLKENVVTLTGAIDRLKQLQPKRFNFIGEEEIIDGFIAHEVSSTAPYAVSGEKDAIKVELVLDEDGKEQFDENGEIISREVIDPQGVDYGKLSALTIAALQEALAKIESLEQRLSDAGIA